MRPRLVRFFSSRGRAWAADDLADEVILRVLQKLRSGESIDSVEAYMLGVARLVLLEHARGPASRQDPLVDDVQAPEPPDVDLGDEDCLERCLRRLPAEGRALILRFYGEGHLHVKNKDIRKQLAVDLGVSMGALFLRASKLRRQLRECMEASLRQLGRLPRQKSAGSLTTDKEPE